MEENEENIPYLTASLKAMGHQWNKDVPPGESVDPEEFWRDEPGKAEGYANVYISKNEFYEPEGPPSWKQVIKPEILGWLNTNAGPRRAYGLDWYQNTQDYDWYVRGETKHQGRCTIQVCVRDLKIAMLLKLKFGGK